MIADEAVFYDYYEYEKPEKIYLDEIISTKDSLVEYNSEGDYDNLVTLMDNLINLCNNVNTDIDNKDYSKFSIEGIYQTELQELYWVFDDWMAEGEL